MERERIHLDRLKSQSAWPGYSSDTGSYAYDTIGNMTTKSGVGTLGYNDAAHKHASSHVNGVLYFVYDANGNMTIRNTPGVGTTTFTWNLDNKVSSAYSYLTNQTTSYSYDADGNRVKKVDASGTTAYVGGHFEKNMTSGEVTTYVYFGGARVAMRKYIGSPTNTSVTWLHSDVLGSASIATNASGGVVANSEQRYTPFGTPRLNASGLPTDKTFTGQRVEAGLGGIMDYGARYYDPIIGRFLSADTVVPGAGNPQALNRYAYTLNNPLRYTDPSGHCYTDAGVYAENCDVERWSKESWQQRIDWMREFSRRHVKPGTFNNIEGILEFMMNDSHFSDLAGWASHADAAVLFAIQEGWNLNSKGPNRAGASGELWASFFDQFKQSSSGLDDPGVWQAWGAAEQSGVEYGVQYADGLGLRARAGAFEQAQIDVFVTTSTMYRDIIQGNGAGGKFFNFWAKQYMYVGPIDPNTPSHLFGLADPRYSKEFVKAWSYVLVVSFADVSSCVSTGNCYGSGR